MGYEEQWNVWMQGGSMRRRGIMAIGEIASYWANPPEPDADKTAWALKTLPGNNAEIAFDRVWLKAANDPNLANAPNVTDAALKAALESAFSALGLMHG